MTRRPTRTRRPPTRRSRRLNLPALAGIAVAILALTAVVLTQGGDGETGPQTGPVRVTGATLPEFAEDGPDAAVGLSPPALGGIDFAGEPSEVLPGGRPTLVLFAAHWCPHCRKELGTLSPWLRGGGAGDTDVVLVATATDPAAPNYPPSAWLERESWPGRVLLDDDADTAAHAYGVSGYPFFVFVDADGRVRERSSGELGTARVAASLAAMRSSP